VFQTTDGVRRKAGGEERRKMEKRANVHRTLSVCLEGVDEDTNKFTEPKKGQKVREGGRDGECGRCDSRGELLESTPF